MITLTGAFGERVARRLEEEPIIWLTTVRADGTPQPSPVWFLWQDEVLLIYSQADKPKLHNIQRNPNVALHFDGDGEGGDIIVITGTAQIETQAQPDDMVAAYFAKYRAKIVGMNLEPAGFAYAYPVAIRVTPTGLRGH